MSQIRDKKAHRKHIATMNLINAKACNSLSCTLLLIVCYLHPYRNHLTSSNIISADYQMITHAREQYKDVIGVIEPNKNKNPQIYYLRFLPRTFSSNIGRCSIMFSSISIE